MPHKVNQCSISKCMRDTMKNRRKWILENCPTIDEIFHEFPRLADFSGQMVNNNVFPSLFLYYKEYIFNFNLLMKFFP